MRIPNKPVVLLVEEVGLALDRNAAGGSGANKSYSSKGVPIDARQFAGLNATVAANSSNTSLSVLAMPSFPDELTSPAADAFMHALNVLTDGLGPVALIHKGDPSKVISLAI